MSTDEPKWRKILVDKLHERNRKYSSSFHDIITQNNRLYDATLQLKSENLKLSVKNEQLRSGNIDSKNGPGSDNGTSATISALEKKLLLQQEELTDLHKRKGENSQMIVDLNIKLNQKNQLIFEKDKTITLHVTKINSLNAEVQMLTTNIDELKAINSRLRDEFAAIQLEFTAQEERLRKVQEENITLVDRIMKNKAKDAAKLNEENENLLRKRDKIPKEIEDAMQQDVRRSSSPTVPFPGGASAERGSLGDVSMKGIELYDTLPARVHMEFDAHEGEVNAVQWSPIERIVATGGADRKVKIWDVGKAKMESRGHLIGSNAAVNSIDFDSTGSMILATSNDYASRVWTSSDLRLRHTLTGHSGKVLAAKFLGESNKVVTGSHDRTLKVWDLRSKACIETKFAGSSCNDLVTTDGSGSTIISGHFDKKIRFWDTRSECAANDIILQGKITSLDLSRDCKYLLSCVRDDTIKLLDLRMNQVVKTFRHDNFKVSCDFCRVAFSPDITKIAAGSADGSVIIWNIDGRHETTLKEHSNAVTAVSWHPFSSTLASVDRAKHCIIWANA